MASEGPSDRLTGWKEIANQLGRSVRTVQRWEHDLGLPVHRIRTPAEGEIIYASRREIEDWLRRGGSHDPPSGLVRRRSVVRFVVTLGVLMVGAAIVWLVRVQPPAQPAGWQVEASKLSALSASGEVVWSHPFDFTLADPYPPNQRVRKVVAVEDLDGDGLQEVLFVAYGWDPSRAALYCFEHDGRLRFVHHVDVDVASGDDTYRPPFVVSGFVTAEESDGTRSIWVISLHHLDFPAVVEKLTYAGQVAGRYWHHGHPTAMAAGWIKERRVMFVGGTDNESGGAALSVVDFEAPGGFAPSVSSDYRCTGCEGTEPLAFFVFSPPGLWRALDHRPYVTDIQVPGAGEFPVRALLTAAGYLLDETTIRQWTVIYRLSSDLDTVQVELDDGYRAALTLLERRDGVQRSVADDAFPVLRWSGSALSPVPEAR